MCETEAAKYDRTDIRIITDDGVPAVELPTGQILRLRVFCTVEDRHEHPLTGYQPDLDVEVTADDFAWWTLYPEGGDEYPELCIEPELMPADSGGESE